jgi:3-phenylpropionate/cinnamic acid dioxygenase small subunit
MTAPLDIETYLAITELKARYCRTLDTKDWDGFADVFTDDFELDTRPSGGALTHGRDEAIKVVRAASRQPSPRTRCIHPKSSSTVIGRR